SCCTGCSTSPIRRCYCPNGRARTIAPAWSSSPAICRARPSKRPWRHLRKQLWRADSLVSDRQRRSVLFYAGRRRAAAALEAGATLLLGCARLPLRRALCRMRTRDQFDTERAKQRRQLAREKRVANPLGKSSRRPIVRGGGSWQADGHGQSKNDEQNAHIMSPFMS